MEIAKVTGKIWATKKCEKLAGQRFSLTRVLDADGMHTQNTLVAVDNIGAGVGDLVLIVCGSAARMALGDQSIPVDAAIVGIVDSVEIKEVHNEY